MKHFLNRYLPLYLLSTILFYTHWAYAYGDYEIFSERGKQGLRSEGQVVIEPNYKKLGWSKGLDLPVGNVIGYYDGAWGLVSVKNKKVTPAKYYSLEAIHGDLIFASLIGRFSNELMYGAINSQGDVVIDFRYHSIKKVKDLLIVSERKKGRSYFGLIDEKNAKLLPVEYRDIRHYSEDLFVFQNTKEKYGIIDRYGVIKSRALLDSIGPQRDGQSVIVRHGLTGLLDSVGNVALTPQYKSIEGDNKISFDTQIVFDSKGQLLSEWRADSVQSIEGFWVTFRNQYFSILNTNFEEILEGKSLTSMSLFRDFLVLQTSDYVKVIDAEGKAFGSKKFDQVLSDDHYLYGQRAGLWEIYNSFGRKIGKGKYDSVLVGSHNLIPVMKRRFWGYLDHTGDVAIILKYDAVSPFQDRLAEVDFLGKKMLINQFGSALGELDYDSIAIQSGNTAIAKKGSRLDLLNGQGIVLFQTYNMLINHELGYLEKTESGRYGLITSRGEQVLSPIYDRIEHVSGQEYVRVIDQGHVGLYDLTGYWIKEFDDKYEDMNCLGEKLTAIKKDGKWGSVNDKDQLLIANRYDSIRCFVGGLAPVKFRDTWGLINENEEIVVQPNLDHIRINGTSFVANRGDSFGLFDNSGTALLHIEYQSIEPLDNGYYLVEKNDKFGVFDADGLQKIPVVYDRIWAVENGQFMVSRRGLTGLVNIEGQFTVPLKYDGLKVTQQKLLIASQKEM